MDEGLQAIQKFEAYLKRRAPESRTWVDYVSDVRQFATTCAKAWDEVNLYDIDAFIDQQRQAGLSPATLKRRVNALKVFFDFLAEDSGDLSWPNPVRPKRHRIKQAKRLPRDLSDEQVSRLWAVISQPRDRAWFALMLRAGLRVAEVAALTLTALLTPASADQPARLRVQGKGQKERIVLLTADAAAVLQAWLDVRPTSEHEAIFLNERGQPLSANGIEWLLRGYSQAAGLKASPHQLRHTFARQLLEGGMPITSLGKLLGHAQISTTEIYTAGADPDLAQAYQTAMTHLARSGPPDRELSAEWSAPSEPEPPPPPPRPVATPTQPLQWEQWAPELPLGLRQVSLAFVQRRWPTWKPQRQRINAQKSLSYLARFWTWQLSQRPLTDPTQVRRADLQAFQQAQQAAGVGPAAINRHLDEILALFRQLTDQGQAIDPALFRLKELVQPERLPRYLPEAQMQRLESYVQQQLDTPDPLSRLENACFFILAHTGLRASECVDLQVQDLDLSGGRLIVRQGKGQRDRVVYLSHTAHLALTIYLGATRLEPTRPLFIRPTGQPISYRWLAGHLTALAQAAGQIAVTPHRLRHTLATRLLNVGMKESRIQKLLGHEHLTTTMIYARVLDTTVEADYRQAMRHIERQQLPLSNTPDLVSNWPVPETLNPLPPMRPVPAELDNSI